MNDEIGIGPEKALCTKLLIYIYSSFGYFNTRICVTVQSYFETSDHIRGFVYFDIDQ